MPGDNGGSNDSKKLSDESQLSNEVIESQKARSDLLKWKIVLVAAVGATGLGLMSREGGPPEPKPEYADLVLICIPLICVYVDLLCRHLSLRINVIGSYREKKYKKDGKDDYLEHYEIYSRRADEKGVFSLENAALLLTSLVLCIGLASVPWLAAVPLPHAELIGYSGWVGIAMTLAVQVHFRFLAERIRKLELE